MATVLRISLIFLLIASSFASAVSGLSIVEATIEELQDALSSGQINAVQLLAKHLHRIARFDRRGVSLNAIPVISPYIFDEAQASDEYRTSTGGKTRSELEGLPCTVKDSYMLKGVTVASGSPVFVNLTATQDAFTVHRIKQGGGIVLGKTNMPPMANGGMQRGVYGKALSPYNRAYLPGAMGSGSSNGCGASTAASMAVFGMGEETVSSGRSPASNNGLVAYTPSWGVLSIRGNWPLQPALDVVVPQTRTVADMLSVLDVLVATDNITTGDFWRTQPWIRLPVVESVRPSSYKSLADPDALNGKRVGVPKMFIGEDDPAAVPVYIRPSVRALWDEVRQVLESMGATVEEVEFPLVTSFQINGTNVVGSDYPLPDQQGTTTPSQMTPYAWDDFLQINNDTNSVTTLADVDPLLIFPQLPGTLPDRYSNTWSNRSSGYIRYVDIAKSRNSTILGLQGLETLLLNVTNFRQQNLEAWMDRKGVDVLVWPANGDVGYEDMEINNVTAPWGWRNGVARSNGNNAIRTFGIPTVGVAMGMIEDIQMPIDLTFASKAYDDNNILRYAYAFETARRARIPPPLTPEIETDFIPPNKSAQPFKRTLPPTLSVQATRADDSTVNVSGAVEADGLAMLEVYLDGASVGHVEVEDGLFNVSSPIESVRLEDNVFRPVNVPDQSLSMVVVIATARNGRSTGKLLYA